MYYNSIRLKRAHPPSSLRQITINHSSRRCSHSLYRAIIALSLSLSLSHTHTHSLSLSLSLSLCLYMPLFRPIYAAVLLMEIWVTALRGLYLGINEREFVYTEALVLPDYNGNDFRFPRVDRVEFQIARPSVIVVMQGSGELSNQESACAPLARLVCRC